MKLIIICILINIIALITSLMKKRSGSKKQFIIRRPFIVNRPPFLISRTIVTPRPLLAVVRPAVIACPIKRGKRILIGKSSGICKSPCTLKTCIQTSIECCFYAKPE